MGEPTPYNVGGIDIAAGSALTVQIPSRVFLGRMTGLLFDTDKTFLLPRSLAGIRGLRRFYDQHPGVQVLVVGHTDTVGPAQYNLTLSNERAHSIAAYLQDDVDGWMEYYPGRTGSAHWGTIEDQHMLKELGFHQGPITGNPSDRATRSNGSSGRKASMTTARRASGRARRWSPHTCRSTARRCREAQSYGRTAAASSTSRLRPATRSPNRKTGASRSSSSRTASTHRPVHAARRRDV